MRVLRYVDKIAVLASCILPTAGVLAADSPAFEHPGGLHSRNQLESARTNIAERRRPVLDAYESFVQQAKTRLEKAPNAVADFNVPGYYQDAKGHRQAQRRLCQDAWTAYSCAIAWQLTTGTERDLYAAKAIETLGAWAKINKKASNFDGNLVMAYAGVGLVFAAELMTDCDSWKKEQREEFKEWVRSVYLKSCKSVIRKANNWGDWGVLGCIASHYFLDDAKGLDDDIARTRRKIDHAIKADGHMPAETGRGKNGLWYTYFALAPLTAACQIAANARGVDLFHYKGKDGAGLEKALDYLLQYSRELGKWPHYQQKDLNLSRPEKWPGNLFEAMSGIYDRKDYEGWITDARPIMLHGHHYAWAVPTLLRTEPPKTATGQ